MSTTLVLPAAPTAITALNCPRDSGTSRVTCIGSEVATLAHEYWHHDAVVLFLALTPDAATADPDATASGDTTASVQRWLTDIVAVAAALNATSFLWNPSGGVGAAHLYDAVTVATTMHVYLLPATASAAVHGWLAVTLTPTLAAAQADPLHAATTDDAVLGAAPAAGVRVPVTTDAAVGADAAPPVHDQSVPHAASAPRTLRLSLPLHHAVVTHVALHGEPEAQLSSVQQPPHNDSDSGSGSGADSGSSSATLCDPRQHRGYWDMALSVDTSTLDRVAACQRFVFEHAGPAMSDAVTWRYLQPSCGSVDYIRALRALLRRSRDGQTSSPPPGADRELPRVDWLRDRVIVLVRPLRSQRRAACACAPAIAVATFVV